MERNGARRIAVCGKGGSGKTTIAGTLARAFARRGHRVIAVDGDSNPNLAITLGIPPDQAEALAPLPRTLLEQRTDETGAQRTVLAIPPEEIFQRYGISAPDDVTLLLMGKVDHGGAG
ncbi:MAG: nucleotide-binding protein [Armatimonadota bacterium]